MASSQVVTYRVDQQTVARFEIDPPSGFGPVAAAGEVIANVHDAVGPALEAAKVVLNRIKPSGSDEVEIRFGVKVSGNDNWSIAKNPGEGNFEVSLTWRKA
jgi:hypothetical protein